MKLKLYELKSNIETYTVWAISQEKAIDQVNKIIAHKNSVKESN